MTRTNNGNKGKDKNKQDANASKLIRENMKCPVCMEVLLPPIYQCETGHNICYQCVDEVQECPLCKGDYGDTRNYFAEELVNSMTFPCKFEEYGCTKVMLGSDLKDHQETCEFQPYRCPELACQEVCGLHQMGKHLDRHGFKIMQGDTQCATLDIQLDHFDRKTEYNPWRVSALSQEFYTVATRQREGIWYFWAYYLGLPKDAKKYSCEIHLFSEDKQTLFRGIVHSLRSQPDTIMEQGNCLIVSDSTIKAIRRDGKLQMRVRFIEGKKWDEFKPPKKIPLNNIPNHSFGKGKVQISNKNPQKPSGFSNQKNNAASAAAANKPQTSMSAPSTPKSATNGIEETTHPAMSTPTISNVKAITDSTTLPSTAPLPNPPISLNPSTETISASESSSTASTMGGSLGLDKNTQTPVDSLSKTESHVNIKVSESEHNFVSKMRESLVCPGCKEVISPPIHQCNMGHSLCHQCKSTRKDCAVCRSPIGTARNFFAEELLYKVYQRCTYESSGCKVCLPSAQIRSHETLCPFAPFECPFNACRQLVGNMELLNHLQGHQIPLLKGNEFQTFLDVPKAHPLTGPASTIPQILQNDSSVAFYPIVVRYPDGNWGFFVASQDSELYDFELQLTKLNRCMAFKGQVLSLRITHEDVMANGGGLLITEKTVKNLKFDDKLTFVVKVFKKTQILRSKQSMFVVKGKYPSATTQAELELFANKKTSTSPEEEDEIENIPELGGVTEDESDTRLNERVDDDHDDSWDDSLDEEDEELMQAILESTNDNEEEVNEDEDPADDGSSNDYIDMEDDEVLVDVEEEAIDVKDKDSASEIGSTPPINTEIAPGPGGKKTSKRNKKQKGRKSKQRSNSKKSFAEDIAGSVKVLEPINNNISGASGDVSVQGDAVEFFGHQRAYLPYDSKNTVIQISIGVQSQGEQVQGVK